MIHRHSHHCGTWWHLQLPLRLLHLITSLQLGTLSYWSRPFRTFGVTSKFAAMFSLTLVGVNEVKLEPMVLHLLLGFDRTQSINAVPEQADAVTYELGFCTSFYLSLSQGLSKPVQIFFLAIVSEQLSDKLGEDAHVEWLIDCIDLSKLLPRFLDHLILRV